MCFSVVKAVIGRMLVTDAPAWKVIWPFLADSIAMAVVESAIEDVDNAMDDYVTQLQF